MPNLPGVGIPSKSQFFLDIARGKIPGHSTASILSFNPDVDIAAEETIWDQGGTYTYLTADTELFISSSSASDTNIGVSIAGMTADFVVKNTIFTFTGGQAQQSIGSFFRIFKVTVISGSAPVGDLYVAESDTLTAGVPDTASKIKGKMIQGINTTRSGVFTVPVNHSLFIVRVISHTRKNKDSVMRPVVRPEGAPGFIETTQFPTFQNSFELLLDPAFVVNEKTDIELKANTATNGTETIGNVGYILIDNTIA